MEDINSRWYGLTVLLILFFPSLSFSLSPDAQLEAAVDELIEFVDEDVKNRLSSLDQNIVEHRFDPAVRAIIKRYVINSRGGASIILGRAAAYLPLFEAQLAQRQLPDALKYLPIVESALRPEAVSRVGAQGLWQFMPATAREYGLRVDDYIDERIDPNRATEAAMQYLIDQYNYFGDWALALAAYNAGQGNVRRALRRGRGRSFWAIRRYLPRETANYVPGFIAATYLAEFFSHHDLTPVLPSLDRQLTESIKLDQPCSFYRIAQVTGLSIDQIEALNPGYKKGYLPGYAGGHYLVLPQRVMPAFREYLRLFPTQDEEPHFPYAPLFVPHTVANATTSPDDAYAEFRVVAAEGDSLSGLASQLGCSAFQLSVWNNCSLHDSLTAGQQLRYFRPVAFKQIAMPPPPPSLPKLACRTPTSLQPLQPCTAQLPASTQLLWYCVTRREKPSQVAERFPQVDTEAVMQQNGLTADRLLPSGQMLRISRK